MAALTRILEYGVAARPYPGQAASGDLHLVAELERGTLLAVVDGLGHGEEARFAAELAIGTLRDNAREALIPLVRRCHEALRPTRGVVLSLAAFNADEDTITWLGIGNIQGLLLRADPETTPASETLLLRGGVVGGQLPLIYAAILPIMPGDTIMFATDGIASDFAVHLNSRLTPQVLADRILATSARAVDDALVLVARYRSASPSFSS